MAAGYAGLPTKQARPTDRPGIWTLSMMGSDYAHSMAQSGPDPTLAPLYRGFENSKQV